MCGFEEIICCVQWNGWQLYIQVDLLPRVCACVCISPNFALMTPLSSRIKQVCLFFTSVSLLFLLTLSSHPLFSLSSHFSATFSDSPPTVLTQGGVEGSHLLDDSFVGAVVLAQEDATWVFRGVVLIQPVQQWHMQVALPCKLTVHKWTELQSEGCRMERERNGRKGVGDMESKVSLKHDKGRLPSYSHLPLNFLLN